MAKNKKQRKARNKRKRERLLAPRDGPPRVRRDFFGKSRPGDEAELVLTFSGDSIFVNADAPVESLNEIHEKTKNLVPPKDEN